MCHPVLDHIFDLMCHPVLDHILIFDDHVFHMHCMGVKCISSTCFLLQYFRVPASGVVPVRDLLQPLAPHRQRQLQLPHLLLRRQQLQGGHRRLQQVLRQGQSVLPDGYSQIYRLYAFGPWA